MRFAEPSFLWGLFSLPLFALLFYYAFYRRKKLSRRFVSLSMLPKLATSVSPWKRFLKVLLLLLAIWIISKYELTDEKMDQINMEIEARAKAE